MSELRQRNPPVKDPGFLIFLRTKPCCVCGALAPSQAAHIRMACAAIGKEPAGMQQKPDDKYAVPLCGPILGSSDPADIGCHALQHHEGDEERFWIKVGKLPFQIAESYYLQYLGLGGPGPIKRRPRAKKARPKPKNRQKIQSRPFPKGRGFPKRGDRNNV